MEVCTVIDEWDLQANFCIMRTTLFHWDSQFGVVDRVMDQDSEQGSNPHLTMETHGGRGWNW